MNRRRLKTLADFLRRVPEQHFSISTWAARPIDAEPHSCATVACAIGWACTIEEFAVEGLELVKASDYSALPYYDEAYGYEAVCSFFEITWETALELFSASGYIGDPPPSAVADKIERTIDAA